VRELRPVTIEKCAHCGETGLFYALEPSAGRILRAWLLAVPFAGAAVYCLIAGTASHSSSNEGGLWLLGGLALAIVPVMAWVSIFAAGDNPDSKSCARCGRHAKPS
jgi:hypothetical protein